MAKWSGKIGFCVPKETDVDVWTEEIIEHAYYGDVLRNSKSPYDNERVNSGFNVSNRISFVADPYARENFYRMKYITFMGTKWIITDAEVENYPRIVVSLGGLWNGS
ncbi:MAG: hypothetical protein IKO19_02700 [Candidatus Riflebacteria bacterium]|nr:hypothetical protein [Candidatus Riflebacteria bacterium]